MGQTITFSFCGCRFIGAFVKLDLVRTFTDYMIGLMALQNLIALLGSNRAE